MELSKDRLTQEFKPMDLIQPSPHIRTFLDPSYSLISNFMLAANFVFKEDILHGTKHQTKPQQNKSTIKY